MLGYGRNDDWYDIMQVCINGHKITTALASMPNTGTDHCDECGARTISKCESCGTNIRGHHHNAGISFGTPVPDWCHKCGKPYPWQNKPATNTKLKEVDSSVNVKLVFTRLPEVVRQLQKRHDERSTLEVNDEYDLQDLLHALLKIYFDDIRTEEYVPSYAGTSSRMDFLLPDKKIVIETKMTRDSLKARKLSQEIIEDKEHYQKHPSCETLYCLVYDPNVLIDNPRGFENDISEKSQNFTCEVTIVS